METFFKRPDIYLSKMIRFFDPKDKKYYYLRSGAIDSSWAHKRIPSLCSFSTDKNGEDIYMHDVVKHPLSKALGVVRYDPQAAGFIITFKLKNGCNITHSTPLYKIAKSVERVGTIFDEEYKDFLAIVRNSKDNRF